MKKLIETSGAELGIIAAPRERPGGAAGRAVICKPRPRGFLAPCPTVDILDYHQRSKHHPQRYAPGPGYLDWDSQPDPFRVFAGAPRTDLPLLADDLPARFGDLRAGRVPPAAPLTRQTVAALFELSLGLSAWKSYGGARWALRCNPSSGNLHPTEAYLVTGALPGIAPGLHHYLSRDHCLEQRAAVDMAAWNGLFSGRGFFVGLSSIFWREAWKYGMRAFRYCQHDCGHAIAALAYAAAALGWRAGLVETLSDNDLAYLLGTARDADFFAEEREAADCLLWITVEGVAPDPAPLVAAIGSATWFGHAARLSADHHPWPDIDQAHARCVKPATGAEARAGESPWPAPLAPALDLPASRLFRQRRSAQAFDGIAEIPAAGFFALLDATLPRSAAPPWNAWPAAAQVHLALFVHRVTGLEPGLYFLLRDEADMAALRQAMRADWLWRKTGPDHLPLYLLLPYDLRAIAAQMSCRQDIAGDSCFSLGMIAGMAGMAEQPWLYRRRFWECGLIGQTLYLEAEAAGLRGTGIGCYFDDQIHQLLGLRSDDWQSLYHFTVGGPLDDARLVTTAPYSARNAEAP
ncbi:MAG: SagB/ThcOx family dehydrogenase [Rhodocyclaceae bacterium]